MRSGTYVAKCNGEVQECWSFDEANDVAYEMFRDTGKLAFVEDYLGWTVLTYEPDYEQSQYLQYNPA